MRVFIIVLIFENVRASVLPVERYTRDVSNSNLEDAIHQHFKRPLPVDDRPQNLPKYLQTTQSYEDTSPDDQSLLEYINKLQSVRSAKIPDRTDLSTPEELVDMKTKEITREELDKLIEEYFPQPNNQLIYNGRPVYASRIIRNNFQNMVVRKDVYEIPKEVLDEIFSATPKTQDWTSTEATTNSNKTGVNGTFDTDDRFQNPGTITAAFRNMLIPPPKVDGAEVATSTIGAPNSPQDGAEIVPPIKNAARNVSQGHAEVVPPINEAHLLIQEKNRSSIDHPPLCFVLMFILFLSIVF